MFAKVCITFVYKSVLHNSELFEVYWASLLLQIQINFILKKPHWNVYTILFSEGDWHCERGFFELTRFYCMTEAQVRCV